MKVFGITLFRETLTLGFALLCMADPGSALDLAVPPTITEQPQLNAIQPWNGMLVARADSYDETNAVWRFRYYHIDPSRGLAPLTVGDCRTVQSVAETSQGVFALCADAQKSVLMSLQKHMGSGWRQHDLPTELRGDEILAASRRYLTLISMDKISWLTSNGEWVKTTLMQPPFELTGTVSPQYGLLTDSYLYLGYDQGEFGGALLAIPFNPDSTRPFGPSKQLSSMNVNAILQDRSGKVWVTGGLAHMDSKWAEIAEVSNGKLTSLLREHPAESPRQFNGPLRLPKRSDIAGACVTPAGQVLVVAPEVGVLAVSDKLTVVIAEQLRVFYHMPNYTVGSSPVGLLCPNENTILIATRSTGVIEFTKTTGTGYTARQFISK